LGWYADKFHTGYFLPLTRATVTTKIAQKYRLAGQNSANLSDLFSWIYLPNNLPSWWRFLLVCSSGTFGYCTTVNFWQIVRTYLSWTAECCNEYSLAYRLTICAVECLYGTSEAQRCVFAVMQHHWDEEWRPHSWDFDIIPSFETAHFLRFQKHQFWFH